MTLQIVRCNKKIDRNQTRSHSTELIVYLNRKPIAHWHQKKTSNSEIIATITVLVMQIFMCWSNKRLGLNHLNKLMRDLWLPLLVVLRKFMYATTRSRDRKNRKNDDIVWKAEFLISRHLMIYTCFIVRDARHLCGWNLVSRSDDQIFAFFKTVAVWWFASQFIDLQ